MKQRSMVRAAAWSVIRRLLCQHSPQRTRPRPIEQLESRTLLTVTVNGTSSADTISVSWNGSSIVTVVNGNSSSHGEDGGTGKGLGGNDTINLISMPNWPLGVNGGDGNDTITFGGGDFDAHFSEFTFVDGDAGTDTVVIDDTTDLGLDEYDLSFDSFFAGGSDFTKTNASVGLYMDPTNENFVLKCNHASNEIIVNDRNSMGLNSIAVQGLDGDDTCEYTNVDTTDAFSFDGGLGANTLKYAQSSFVSTSFTFTFNALDFGPNNLTWLNTQTAQITGTTAADTFNINVLGTSTSLEVIGDLGNDTYNVGNGDIAGNIFGPLRITDFNSQGEGIDKVFYNDGLDTGNDTYTMKNGIGSFNKTGLNHPIDAFVESYTMTANSGNDTITAIPAGSINFDYIVHGGAGDDDITFGDGSIRGLQGNVTLTGETGNDSLTIDDSAVEPTVVTDKDYTFVLGNIHYDVNGAHDFDITESNIETVSLNAGPLNNTFDVSLALGNESTLNLSGGDGADTLHLEPFTTTATINFDGGTVTALDSVIIDDSARTTATAYTLVRQTFDVPGCGLLGFPTIERVPLLARDGADTFNLTGSAAGALYTVDCGDGNDVITRGNNDLDSN